MGNTAWVSEFPGSSRHYISYWSLAMNDQEVGNDEDILLLQVNVLEYIRILE